MQMSMKRPEVPPPGLQHEEQLGVTCAGAATAPLGSQILGEHSNLGRRLGHVRIRDGSAWPGRFGVPEKPPRRFKITGAMY